MHEEETIVVIHKLDRIAVHPESVMYRLKENRHVNLV